MSTTIDIHYVTHVYLLDEVKSSGVGSARRTIVVVTRDGTHNLELTLYGNGASVPVTIGDCPDE
jgi:hypothetical protein